MRVPSLLIYSFQSGSRSQPVQPWRQTMRNLRWVGLSLMAALLLSGASLIQVEIERRAAGQKDTVGFTAVVGPNLTQDTFFKGIAAEYNRLLTLK